MKRHLHSSGGILAVIALLLIGGCGKKTFQSSEPAPTLEITALQDSYAIDRAAYLQIDVAQQGYEGATCCPQSSRKEDVRSPYRAARSRLPESGSHWPAPPRS